jgi:5,10-methylenetetrahydromethanopterin reductase
MALTFEAEISPGMAVREVVELGRLAEQAGFDRLGISCVALWPDTYQLQALVAAATSRIHIGSMVTNPYTRHAAVHAAALATLQDVSDGRAFCGLGVGAGLEALGMDYPQPARTLRETLTAIDRLLRGETVTHESAILTLRDAALLRPPAARVPIAIGTRSPQVMRLAGELADIALVGARHLTPEIVANYRTWLAEGAARAGRPVAAIQVMPRVTLCVSRDGELAVDSVKRFAAHYLGILGDRGPAVPAATRAAIARALERARGWYFDLARYDPPELLELVDADLARAFAVAGTPAQCAEQLRAVLDLGFSGVSCNLAAVRRESNYLGLRETIEGGAEVLSLLRRA